MTGVRKSKPLPRFKTGACYGITFPLDLPLSSPTQSAVALSDRLQLQPWWISAFLFNPLNNGL